MSVYGDGDSLAADSTKEWGLVLTVALAIVPLMAFWGPFRRVINEYRLYRRCQQYPHIVVCKENPSQTNYERIGDVWKIEWALRIASSLIGILIWGIGILGNVLVTIFSSIMPKKVEVTTETSQHSHDTITETSEEQFMAEHAEMRIQSTLISSEPLSRETKPGLAFEGTIRGKITPCDESYEMPSAGRETVLLQPSPEKVKRFEKELPHKPPSFSKNVTIAPSKELRKRRNYRSMMRSTQHVPIDSSSLSEKMKKRRLDGDNRMGKEIVLHQSGDGSRKRRKLDSGRVPLQGHTIRRSTAVGSWRTSRMIDKREREEREVRLLRGMSRKRMKPPQDSVASIATNLSLPSSTTPSAAVISGEAPGNISGSTSKLKEKDAAPNTSTPAPSFQFGNTNSKPSDMQNKLSQETKQDGQSVPTFSFGNATPAAVSATASGGKGNQPSNPESVAPFQFGASTASAETATSSKPKNALELGKPTGPKNTAPTFGAAPTASHSAPTVAKPPVSVQPTTFGAGSTPASTFPVACGFGAGGTGMQTPAISGASTSTQNPVNPPPVAAPPSFGAAPALSVGQPTVSFGGAPVPAQFGSGTVPSTASAGPQVQQPKSFGSQTNALASGQSFTFGNTKENTNPGNSNSSFQQGSTQSNGFMKAAPINGPPLGMNGGFAVGAGNGAAMPAFGAGSAGGFSTGTNSGASARRMARKSRSRRR